MVQEKTSQIKKRMHHTPENGDSAAPLPCSYACMYVCMHMCACMCSCVCRYRARVCGSKAFFSCWLSFSLSEGLSLIQSLPIGLGCPGTKLPPLSHHRDYKHVALCLAFQADSGALTRVLSHFTVAGFILSHQPAPTSQQGGLLLVLKALRYTHFLLALSHN